MLLLGARRSLVSRTPSAIAAQRIHSRVAACVRSPRVRFSPPLVQSRWLSAAANTPRDEDNEATHKAEKEKLAAAAALLRQKLKEDVQRAKELVNNDVERAKELALHQIVNVPNTITFARILATPYLGYLIYDGSYTTAVGVLAVAGLSDWLDGFIARRYKQESIIGSFLDPFADKLMVGTLSLSMLASGLLPWPLVVLVFGRDVMLISGTFYHRLKTKAADSAFFDTTDSGAFKVEASMISKVNTALQIATFGFALTNAAWQVPGNPAMDILFGVVGTTTFLSGSEYLWSYINKTGAFQPLPPREVVSKAAKPVKEHERK